MTETAPASSAVRPEPGIRMTSPLVWNTSRSASVVGSSTPSSKERSYWIVGGWFSAWMTGGRSEEHTSELQSRLHLVCRLLLEKKKKKSKSKIVHDKK